MSKTRIPPNAQAIRIPTIKDITYVSRSIGFHHYIGGFSEQVLGVACSSDCSVVVSTPCSRINRDRHPEMFAHPIKDSK